LLAVTGAYSALYVLINILFSFIAMLSTGKSKEFFLFKMIPSFLEIIGSCEKFILLIFFGIAIGEKNVSSGIIMNIFLAIIHRPKPNFFSGIKT